MIPKTAIADVGPRRQTNQYSCMATSLAMALKANGVDTTEEEVNRVMGARPMDGAAWEDALACAQHFGMRATLTLPATVNQLKEWTDKSIPVVIAWNPEGRPWGHASVVFDVKDGKVHVADPNIPNPEKVVREVDPDDFYSKWYEKHGNGYLIRRPAMAVEREVTPEGKQVVASYGERETLRSNKGMSGWYYYMHAGSGWYKKFVESNPEFNTDYFFDYVVGHNRADRDAGEVQDIALHEILRLAAEYAERQWRFPNVYGEANTAMGKTAWDSLSIHPLTEKRAKALSKIKKKIEPHMWVISKDSAGGYLVTIGDPRKSGSKIKKRFSDKNDLKDWVKHEMKRTVSDDHVIDISGLRLVPEYYTQWYVDNMMKKKAAPPSKQDVEKALKSAGLKYRVTSGKYPTFLIQELGPALHDQAEISQHEKGWDGIFEGRTFDVSDPRALSKIVGSMKKKYEAYQRTKKKGAQETTMSTASEYFASRWGSFHPSSQALIERQGASQEKADLDRLIEAKKSEDEDKEGKFERGEDVPLHKMPKKLQENAKNPPPSVQKVKERIKSKKAAQYPFLNVEMGDSDLPECGTTLTAEDTQWVVVGTYTFGDKGHVWLAREDEFDKIATMEELDQLAENGAQVSGDKVAARAPAGLYGYTKGVQSACEVAQRRLHKAALKIATQAVHVDGKVADFWKVRATRAKSQTARMLLAALEANQKVAAETGQTVHMGKLAAEKEAAYGYYGFRAKTARRAFAACQALREEAGVISADLHRRQAQLHEKITGFLSIHAKKAKCGASKMLFESYPDMSVKIATGPENPDSVSQWLTFEPED